MDRQKEQMYSEFDALNKQLEILDETNDKQLELADASMVGKINTILEILQK